MTSHSIVCEKDDDIKFRIYNGGNLVIRGERGGGGKKKFTTI